MLGFTWYWGVSRKGKPSQAQDIVQPFSSSARPHSWLVPPLGTASRHSTQRPVRKLRGHYAYFGIVGNARALSRFLHELNVCGATG